MRVLRLPALLACVAAGSLGLASGAGAAADPYAALLAPSGTCGATADQLGLDATAAQLAMQCLTNFARTRQGLAPLQLNPMLNAAGQAKLKSDLSCGDFTHTPCGQPFDNVFATYVRGATSYEIGENIAWGTGSFGTPRQTMNAWLHSPEHRQNILSADYSELGVGYLPGQTFQGSTGATLWSQEFGSRVASEGVATSGPLVQKPTAKPKRKPHRPKRRTTPAY